jgi:hypothetical protein
MLAAEAIMWAGMIVFWGLLICGIYALISSASRRPAARSTAAMPGESWTSGWPAARSTPRSTGGSAT